MDTTIGHSDVAYVSFCDIGATLIEGLLANFRIETTLRRLRSRLHASRPTPLEP
jgi:hypothetical protein